MKSLAQPPLTGPSAQASDSKNTADPSARVLRQFRLIFSSIRRHFQTIEKVAGVGGAQIWALSLIAQTPGLAVTQLSQAMDIHQSTASNLVRALLNAGFVHSEKSVHDKRVDRVRQDYPKSERSELNSERFSDLSE